MQGNSTLWRSAMRTFVPTSTSSPSAELRTLVDSTLVLVVRALHPDRPDRPPPGEECRLRGPKDSNSIRRRHGPRSLPEGRNSATPYVARLRAARRRACGWWGPWRRLVETAMVHDTRRWPEPPCRLRGHRSATVADCSQVASRRTSCPLEARGRPLFRSRRRTPHGVPSRTPGSGCGTPRGRRIVGIQAEAASHRWDRGQGFSIRLPP